MADFTGRVALVTGGSLGIGRAAVERLARGGAAVVFCGADAASVDAAQGSLAAAGLAVEGVVADVASDAAMAGLAARAVERFGGVDVLVCSAGVQHYGTVVDTPEDEWDRVMAVNVKGMYLAARHAIPAMLARGGGAIVNVASVQAFVSQLNVAPYATSKAAILALTRSTALDFAAQGVRCNAVCPGSVDTPMLRASAELFSPGHADEMVAAWGRNHPLGRVATVEEVAEAIAFLASERASFVTGTSVNVDGGLLAANAVALPDDPAAASSNGAQGGAHAAR